FHVNELLVVLGFGCFVLVIERALAFAAPQVGDAYAREHLAVQSLRGKSAWTAQNGAGNTGSGERIPQRSAFSPIDYAGLSQNIFRPREVAQSNIGLVGFRIAADEVKNSVSAWISSSDK